MSKIRTKEIEYAPSPDMYGDGSDGAVGNLSSGSTEATSVSTTSTHGIGSGAIVRSQGNVAINEGDSLQIQQQDGIARQSDAEIGSEGIDPDIIMNMIGTSFIPPLEREGTDATGACGGWVQIIADGNVSINGILQAKGLAPATNAGGAGGGLVIIVCSGSFDGSGTIDISGAVAGATANGKGGGGSYSGRRGGHAGYGGSGGGAGTNDSGDASAGTGGAGFVAGNAGGTGGQTDGGGGGGGGALAEAGSNGAASGGGGGGDGGSNELSGEIFVAQNLQNQT